MKWDRGDVIAAPNWHNALTPSRSVLNIASTQHLGKWVFEASAQGQNAEVEKGESKRRPRTPCYEIVEDGRNP
jgi:hypothetical protein